ncbi:isochorismatase family protein [Paenactinomyces guangxiensis]|uniref:Isochorismatase family protein n=1 Tax=Paenactinomyces guangxiensis TaxID=1490290 RepID=A0A7W1WUJ1_9BACL|nr:isochorismatase family protein [Paenactinomyces guangxiensis]MBA4496328.1 isochorismatase family protein [Paenactinomyces guangxiensis]MBH8590857.1 isochorismatase family protein [Paenactinomyces guangxiensis]
MDFSQLRVKPLRFIPFDLGVNLSPKERKEIHLYLKNKYLVKELDERKKAILSREPIIASIYGKDDKLELYLFDTGIGVFVLKDKTMMYKEDIRFAAKFLKDRKDCHHSILEGKYSESLAIHKVINEIRSVLSPSNKKMRVSGLPSWEYDGLSYVMSIYFFFPIQQIKQTISFTYLPDYLQKGIPAILNPAYFINEEGSPYRQYLNWERLSSDLEQELHPQIKPYAKTVFKKGIYTAINDETLLYIKENNISKIFILGIDTDCCVLKTAVDLFEHHLHPIVLSYYSASNGGKESHNAAIKVLERLIGRQNIIHTELTSERVKECYRG